MVTFFKRTFSTIILLSLLAGSIFLKNPYSFYIFSVLAVLLSYFTMNEFGNIMNASGNHFRTRTASFIVSILVVFSLCGVFTCFSVLYSVIVIILFAAAVWMWVLFSCNEPAKLRGALNTAGAVLMFTVPMIAIVNIYIYGIDGYASDGRMAFFYLILVTKAGDIGAYLVGSLTNAVSKGGNHKMIPRISPGKSFEGAVGGMAFSIGVSIVLWKYCFLALPICNAVYLSVLLFFFGMAGDLAESSFKRTCGVKDSGKTLPGIGGLFDLVDSLMINSIVFILYFIVLRAVTEACFCLRSCCF